MTPNLRAVTFALRDASRPLLVLGPSLGTSVTALWSDAAALLAPHMDVVGWDLPGHGVSQAPEADDVGALTVAELAAEVLRLVDTAQAERGDPGAGFWYAGVSVGGAVGAELLAGSSRVLGGVLLATAAHFGDPAPWLERADLVLRAGTPTQVTGSAGRWFAPGFVERHPDVATRLLSSLQHADPSGYAAVCHAIARFDVRDRLAGITAPVVAVAGAVDPATPPDRLAEIADAVPGARLEVLDDVAHLPPAEAPDRVAALVRGVVVGERETA